MAPLVHAKSTDQCTQAVRINEESFLPTRQDATLAFSLIKQLSSQIFCSCQIAKQKVESSQHPPRPRQKKDDGHIRRPSKRLIP